MVKHQDHRAAAVGQEGRLNGHSSRSSSPQRNATVTMRLRWWLQVWEQVTKNIREAPPSMVKSCGAMLEMRAEVESEGQSC